MRSNAQTFAALALLTSVSTSWACESREFIDDRLSGIAREVVRSLTPDNDDASAIFEQWTESCYDLRESPQRGASDDGDVHANLGVREQATKSTVATGTFVIPSTAPYGWVAVRYTKGRSCGSAKVYFDGRFIESIDLYDGSAARQCERLYYLQDHSAKAHRFEALIERRPGNGSGGYACLDSVVAGW